MKCSECGNVGPCPQCEPDKFSGLMEPTVPRAVADRLAAQSELARKLLGYISDGGCTCDDDVENSDLCETCAAAVAADGMGCALAEYRKAVTK